MLHKVAAFALALVVALVLVVRYTRGRDPAEVPPAVQDAPQARDEPPRPEAARNATPAPSPTARVDLAPQPKVEPASTGETEWNGTLSGRLDDSVPRPVAGGRVWLHLREAWVEDEPANERDFEAEVRVDGSFELTGLPYWRGQILAWCEGWVSRPTPFDPLARASFRRGRDLKFGEIEQAFQEEGAEAPEPQRVVVSYPGALVVVMEPAGSLAVTARRPDGAPLAGALVSAAPSVTWFGGAPRPFPGRSWSATSDADGLARLDQLPAGAGLRVDVQHDSFRMQRAERDGPPSVTIVSGKTAELELALEPVEE